MSKTLHDEADQQRLNETMRTLVELLVGSEIEAMRKKIAAVGTNLNQRLDQLEETTQTESRKTLTELCARLETIEARLGAAEQGQDKAFEELSGKTQRSMANLKGQIKQLGEKSEKRIDAAQDELRQAHSASEAMIKGELDGLCQGLTALQIELQQQMVATERISGLLDNLAGVFSTKRSTAEPNGAMPQAMTSTSPEQLDNEIDRVFEAHVNSEKPTS